jgi:hypothetical protein
MDPHHVHTPPPPEVLPEKRKLTPEAWEALQKLQTQQTMEAAASHDYVPIALTRTWEDYADKPKEKLTPEEEKRADELIAKVKAMKEEQAKRAEEAVKNVKPSSGSSEIKDLSYN